MFLGVWSSGSRLQPRVQPLELSQVSGTMATRREGWDSNDHVSGVISELLSELDFAAGEFTNLTFLL